MVIELVTTKHSRGGMWQDKGHLEEGMTPGYCAQWLDFRFRAGIKTCNQVTCVIYVDFILDRAWLNSFLEGDSRRGHCGDSSTLLWGLPGGMDRLWSGSSRTFPGLEKTKAVERESWPRIFYPQAPSWHMVPLLRLTLKMRTLCAGDMGKCWKGTSVG